MMFHSCFHEALDCHITGNYGEDQIARPSDLGRALAAMRRTAPGVCARCGAPFVRLRTARFCSKACSSASTQRERTARWLARKREGRRIADNKLRIDLVKALEFVDPGVQWSTGLIQERGHAHQEICIRGKHSVMHLGSLGEPRMEILTIVITVSIAMVVDVGVTRAAEIISQERCRLEEREKRSV